MRRDVVAYVRVAGQRAMTVAESGAAEAPDALPGTEQAPDYTLDREPLAWTGTIGARVRGPGRRRARLERSGQSFRNALPSGYRNCIIATWMQWCPPIGPVQRKTAPGSPLNEPSRHGPEMTPHYRFPDDIDPFVNPQDERSLPLQPSLTCLADAMALVEPRLGRALLDDAGRAALHAVARRIPSMLATFWGLEVRLGNPSARVDLLWEVRHGNGGIATLAGRNASDPAPGIATALRERSEFWKELARFAGEWLDDPDWLKRLANVWLEADTASATGAGLDACLDRPNLFWGANTREAGADRNLFAHLPALARRFYGLQLNRHRIDFIERTFPCGALLFQMGVMGAREYPIMRLCVKHPDPETLVRWLVTIGWPGDQAAVRDILARLTPLVGEIALNVDILPDRVGEKLGLELYGAERTLSVATWQPLFDELRAKRLTRADKLAALKDFPSIQRYRQLFVWRRSPPLGFPMLVTNLHHIKLVIVADAVVEAKAYLGIFLPAIDYAGATPGSDIEGGWL